jgi:hypothetical protein
MSLQKIAERLIAISGYDQIRYFNILVFIEYNLWKQRVNLHQNAKRFTNPYSYYIDELPSSYRMSLLNIVMDYAPLYFKYFDANGPPIFRGIDRFFIPINDPTVFLLLPIKNLMLNLFRNLEHKYSYDDKEFGYNVVISSHKFAFNYCDYSVVVDIAIEDLHRLTIEIHNLKFVLVRNAKGLILKYQVYFMEKLRLQIWSALKELSVLEVFYYFNSNIKQFC